MSRPRFLRLEAVVAQERHAGISAAAEAIASAGGWVVNHTFFSDTMAVINFLLDADHCQNLIDALKAREIAAALASGDCGPESSGEVFGQLTLTFSQGTGNLRHEVPAFS